MVPADNISFRLQGYWKWDNVKEWIEQFYTEFHSGCYLELKPAAPNTQDRQQRNAILKAFKVAEAHAQANTQWNLVELAIDAIGETANETSGNWHWGTAR
jgi:hypothetical protein